MFEGVGLYTILGTLGTIGLGVVTPMDCYVGLAMAEPNGTFKIAEPVGSLGCQVDFDNTRVFAEHLSSPAKGNDWPGINHVGVKQRFVNSELFGAYVGVSGAVPSKQLKGSPLLSQVGAEFGSNRFKFYGEYILSVDKPTDGMMAGGVKFIF